MSYVVDPLVVDKAVAEVERLAPALPTTTVRIPKLLADVIDDIAKLNRGPDLFPPGRSTVVRTILIEWMTDTARQSKILDTIEG